MPMAVRDAKNVRATVMAVTVARVGTVRIVVIARIAVIAASARTVHRRTTSSRWKASQLIPEDQRRLQPPLTVHHVLAILQRVRLSLRHRRHLLQPLRWRQWGCLWTALPQQKLRWQAHR